VDAGAGVGVAGLGVDVGVGVDVVLLLLRAFTTEVTDTFRPIINLLTRRGEESAASLEGVVVLPTLKVLGVETESYEIPAIN
jgi:hypothetical protein